MPRVLIVDLDNAVRTMWQEVLERDGFEVTTASSVTDAISHIIAKKFDVLLSDLHIHHAGDGLTVVSAMRNAHPQALTLVLSGYPALDEALAAIRSQVDQVLVKPIGIAPLRELVRKGLTQPVDRESPPVASVASILEHELDVTIRHWMSLVEHDEELTCISLSIEDRANHLPHLLRDLICRLRLPPTNKCSFSIAARQHGSLRREQGYTAPMVVEESRILQVSIFNTLQENLCRVDFRDVLQDVITIADEVDSQLKQAMISFVEQPACSVALGA